MNITETDDHVVAELKSSSGASYAVGYPKSAGYTLDEVTDKLSSPRAEQALTDSYSSLTWNVGGDSITSRAAINLGLVGGYVTKDDGIIYAYRLHFANESGWRFTFIDQTNDTYFCSTPRNGNHYIDYNSSRATITGVK